MLEQLLLRRRKLSSTRAQRTRESKESWNCMKLQYALRASHPRLLRLLVVLRLPSALDTKIAHQVR